MAVSDLKEVIVKGLEQTFPAKLGLEELVFGNAISTTYDVETIQADVYNGIRGEAGYTARGAKGQTVGLDGWETKTWTPPLIDENFVVTAQDLKVRGFGESNINTNSEQKFQNIVNRNIKKLKNRKQRKYNSQIVELITTGKVTIVEKDDKGNVKATREADFEMPSTHIYTVGTAWNDSAADIFKDMEDADELVVKDSGVTPDWAIVGKTTLSDMVNNDKIAKLIDSRRVEFGNLKKENKGNGLTFWGNLLGKDIYTFTEFDSAGNALIPDSAYIIGSSQAELDILFGSIDVMKDGVPTVVEGEEVVVPTSDEDAVASKFAFKSAKLYALTQSGAFAHLTTR